MLCTVLLAPLRLSRVVQCSQQFKNCIFGLCAEGIECSMLLKIILKCLSLRVVVDLVNQVVNVNAM